VSDLEGLIEAVIAGDPAQTEDADLVDWKIGVQLGAGPIRDSPDATIQLGHEQAEAIRRGDLHPVEALITGQLRLEGDLGLIIQLQAIAMMAAPRA
jgi:putative sterol carrier protein